MGEDDSTASGGEDGEDHDERINRELIELLNELRVALPGVQVLFAFLLAVPFAQGWTHTTTFQRDMYFGTLLATALSSALLIAPSAYHRINFRMRDKERLLLTSNRLAIAGLVTLAVAITSAIALIADFIYGPAVPMVAAAGSALVFVGLWFVIPLVRRDPADESG